MSPLLLAQLWTSTLSQKAQADGVKLSGNWQSCQARSEDGSIEYGERVFEYRVNGVLKWSLHLGPKDQFALYPDLGPDGPDHTHDVGNLLTPEYIVSTSKTWAVPTLKLKVDVVLAGGSRDECESYYVQVERLK